MVRGPFVREPLKTSLRISRRDARAQRFRSESAADASDEFRPRFLRALLVLRGSEMAFVYFACFVVSLLFTFILTAEVRRLADEGGPRFQDLLFGPSRGVL